jgi:hypothetical protein
MFHFTHVKKTGSMPLVGRNIAMTQKDYILRMFEEVGRVLAGLIQQRQVNPQAAHELLDEQFKQAVGMGSGFLQNLPDETLLAMLSPLGELNIDKCWLLASLLKYQGDLYDEEGDEDRSYFSSLKALNLFLAALQDHFRTKQIPDVEEVEALLVDLEDFDLPYLTKYRLFWYFEATTRYAQAETLLYDLLESTPPSVASDEEQIDPLELGEFFYARLADKTDDTLANGDFSREQIHAGLARLQEMA